MKTARISSIIDLTEGGCNACGIIKCESYTLTMDGLETPLEELTVSTLVMTLALKSGFKQEMKMALLDDYISFTKGDLEVKLFEDYDRLTYKSAAAEMNTRDRIADTQELTETANNILTTLFQIEAIAFEY
ncbi:DUF4809 family protein [Enterococcus sp. BWB1-3]|uniref:DUF4809 family protein n=1 Tax=unclassified Enterococcus TaxID=2608891 RepID=UPI001921C5FB|nr:MULTISPECIES: DUF4809 family protein [unclassified Enterococcus]MBL1229961.1 DUF4809 family protein [Enterococcus sp. BWB1-3]MCB5952959.1 DUF4809 family protein [Enterococcus sp. BWT-B8]MCB5953534.1 DUF4809 family protein [Enterococcus sp. CWB-B31]